MTIDFKNRVAIVTGAGNGLGKSHAIALAARGCKVVVNDLGGARDGSGGSLSAAEEVVNHINASGGEAIADGANVTDETQVAAMVKSAMDKWGRIDILVNNAGILRDKTFHKMTLDDFRAVIDVHLVGSAVCTHTVWPVMREQAYGRVIFTSSPSGLHGIFGQANYGAAKAGMIGMMNALHLEGAKYNIKTNILSPSAKTRMTEDLGIPEAILDQMTPEAITAAMLFLVSEDGAVTRDREFARQAAMREAISSKPTASICRRYSRRQKTSRRAGKEISATENVHYYENSAGPNMNFMEKAKAFAESK